NTLQAKVNELSEKEVDLQKQINETVNKVAYERLQVAQRDATIAELNATIQELQAKDTKAVDLEIARLGKQLNDANADLAQRAIERDAERKASNERINELTEQFEASDAAIEVLTAQRDGVAAQLAQRTAERNVLAAQLALRTAERDAALAREATLKGELKAVKKRLGAYINADTEAKRLR
ncbi:MAG: hypothetical protein JWO53_1003, partial [Chlamydiia bacterium]|nr:hypothetical protein [Chlamydiia bacterium]